MFDAFQLKEQLVGVLVGTTAELAAIVAEHGVDHRTLLLEGGQDHIL